VVAVVAAVLLVMEMPMLAVLMVDLVSSSSLILLDKYRKDCYNPKYLKQT
tara:strand:+ start:560 stop:709 length:150 start_codon:yes stop_codon:yes gene_type:complete